MIKQRFLKLNDPVKQVLNSGPQGPLSCGKHFPQFIITNMGKQEMNILDFSRMPMARFPLLQVIDEDV